MIEEKLLKWIKEKRLAGECLSGPRIRCMALQIVHDEKIVEFKAYQWLDGFLYRFKN